MYKVTTGNLTPFGELRLSKLTGVGRPRGASLPMSICGQISIVLKVVLQTGCPSFFFSVSFFVSFSFSFSFSFSSRSLSLTLSLSLLFLVFGKRLRDIYKEYVLQLLEDARTEVE